MLWFLMRQKQLYLWNQYPFRTYAEQSSGERWPLFMMFLIAMLVPATSRQIVQAEEHQRPPFRVVGYLPEYRLKKFEPDQAANLTDLVLFAAEPTADGGIDLGKLNDFSWDRVEEARTQHGVRIYLCLGGWGRSDHFSQAVLSPAARTRLVESTLTLLKQRKLDGLDLDWEHPRGDEEESAYAVLLEELGRAFKPHGLKLSLTIAPWKKLPSNGYAAVDHIQLMSYDYGQRHSTYEQAHKDVNSWMERGIPAEKIVLGLPFYGRDINDRTKTITYTQVQRRFQTEADIDEVQGYFFNGPKTIRQKTRMALDKNLGGVMVWEVGQDTQDETSLLQAIQRERSEPSPRKWTSPIRRIPRRLPTSQ